MFPFSDEDLLPAVTSIIQTKISPMLARDGGAIQLITVKNATVYIQLQGACVGCNCQWKHIEVYCRKRVKRSNSSRH